MKLLKRIAITIGVIFGVYLVFRGIIEIFIVDYSDPSSYEKDWGGPSLFGVLLVHCGPGVISAVLLWLAWRRRKAAVAD